MAGHSPEQHWGKQGASQSVVSPRQRAGMREGIALTARSISATARCRRGPAGLHPKLFGKLGRGAVHDDPDRVDENGPEASDKAKRPCHRGAVAEDRAGVLDEAGCGGVDNSAVLIMVR